MKQLFVCLALAAATVPAWAAVQSVRLAVPGMTCAACPITVTKALAKVDGVSKSDVNLKKREVLVTFDDAKTNVQQLTDATKEAGYPSTVKQGSTK